MSKIKSLIQTKPLLSVSIIIILVIVMAIMAARLILPKSNNRLPGTSATFTAKQGPLTISVTESGTIQAREQVVIKSKVEGKTTILSLIPEGTMVKKGDVLIELDASQ